MAEDGHVAPVVAVSSVDADAVFVSRTVLSLRDWLADRHAPSAPSEDARSASGRRESSGERSSSPPSQAAAAAACLFDIHALPSDADSARGEDRQQQQQRGSEHTVPVTVSLRPTATASHQSPAERRAREASAGARVHGAVETELGLEGERYSPSSGPSSSPRMLTIPISGPYSLVSFRALPPSTPRPSAVRTVAKNVQAALTLHDGARANPHHGILLCRSPHGTEPAGLQCGSDAAASMLDPQPSYTPVKGLPLSCFSGFVRDYTAVTVQYNVRVMTQLWREKKARYHVRMAVPGADGSSTSSSVSAEQQQQQEQPSCASPSPSRPLFAEGSPSSDTAAVPSVAPSAPGDVARHESASSAREGTTGAAPLGAVAWQEEEAMERAYAGRWSHRFLVSDETHHAIWALQVSLSPLPAVRVVPPAAFYTDGSPSAVEGADEAVSVTSSTTAQSPHSTSSVGRARSRSATASAAAADALAAPLLGGARGFVDGHFSIARFSRPTALCWRQEEEPDPRTAASEGSGGAQGEDSEDEGADVLRTAAGRTADGQAPVELREGAEHLLLSSPRHCHVLFISDSGNAAIRCADFRTRIVRTVVGLDGVPGYRDGGYLSSLLREATAMAWCSSGLLFCDGPNAVLRLVTGIGAHRTAAAQRPRRARDSRAAHASAAAAKEEEKEEEESSTRAVTTTSAVEGTAGVEAMQDATFKSCTTAAAAAAAAHADAAAPSAHISVMDALFATDAPASAENALPAREDALPPLDAVAGTAAPTGGVDVLDALFGAPALPPCAVPAAGTSSIDILLTAPAPTSPAAMPTSVESSAPAPPAADSAVPCVRDDAASDAPSSSPPSACNGEPRVWTVAGAIASADHSTRGSNSARSPYVDAAAANRAFIGFPADVAVVPNGLVDEATVLFLDRDYHAVRLLDSHGVRTLVGPLDYCASDDDDDGGGGGVGAARTRRAPSSVQMPQGLTLPTQLIVASLVKERAPPVFGVHHGYGGAAAESVVLHSGPDGKSSNAQVELPQPHIMHAVTPDAYLHSASLLLFVGSAVTGAWTMMLPVAEESLERLALQHEAEVAEAAQREEEASAVNVAALAAAAPRRPRAWADELASLLRLGVATDGRRTIGESGLPSVGRLALPFCGSDDANSSSDSSSRNSSAPAHSGSPQEDGRQWTDSPGSMPDHARRAAELQALLRSADATIAEQYMRLHFPWILPPPLAHTEKCLCNLYCHVSGRRQGTETTGAAGSPLFASHGQLLDAAIGHAPPHLAVSESPSPSRERAASAWDDSLLVSLSPQSIQRDSPHSSPDGTVEGEGKDAADGASRPRSCSSRRTVPLLPPEKSMSPSSPAASASKERECSRPASVPTPPSSSAAAVIVDLEAAAKAMGSGNATGVSRRRTVSYGAQFDSLDVRDRQRLLEAAGGEYAPARHLDAAADTAPEEQSAALHSNAAGETLVSSLAASARPPPLTQRALAAHRLMHRRGPHRTASTHSAPTPAAAAAVRARDAEPPNGQKRRRAHSLSSSLPNGGPASSASLKARAHPHIGVHAGSAEGQLMRQPPPPAQTSSMASAPSARSAHAAKSAYEAMARRYDDAVSRLRSVYEFFANCAANGGGATAQRSVTLTSLLRFLYHTGYLALPVSMVSASAVPASNRHLDDRPRAAPWPLLARVEDDDPVRFVPLSAADWRCVGELLHRCGVRTRGHHLPASVGFAEFRRLVLLLTLWEQQVTAFVEQSQLRNGASAAASAVPRRRGPMRRSTVHGEEAKERHAGRDGDDDEEEQRFGLLDSLPALDALTEEEVIDAYRGAYNRAAECVPGFYTAQRRQRDKRRRTASRSPRQRAVHAAAVGRGESAWHPALPAVVHDAEDDGGSSRSSLASSLNLSSIGGGGAATPSTPPLSARAHAASPQPPSTPRQVEVTPEAVAADDVLRLLVRNELTLRQLFDAYSRPARVRRSALYRAPCAAAAAAAAAASSRSSSVLLSCEPTGERAVASMALVHANGNSLHRSDPRSRPKPLGIPRTDLLYYRRAPTASGTAEESERSSGERRGSVAPATAGTRRAYLSASAAASAATAAQIRSALDGAAARGCPQDIAWKLPQAFTTSAHVNAATRLATSEVVSVVAYSQFQAMWRVLDVFPSLVSQSLLRLAFVDAVCGALFPLSTGPAREANSSPHDASVNISTSSAPDTPAKERAAALAALQQICVRRGQGADAASAAAAPPTAATRARGTVAASVSLGGCSAATTPLAGQLPSTLENYLCDNAGLTFPAFLDGFVRVALTAFSVDGPRDAQAFPTAAAKLSALCLWVNKQVALGLVHARESEARGGKGRRAGGPAADGPRVPPRFPFPPKLRLFKIAGASRDGAAHVHDPTRRRAA